MPPRFYVPEAREGHRTVELPEEEAAHLTRVLRLGPGAHIRIFNGRGEEWEARVEQAEKRTVSVCIETRLEPAREPRISITLAASVLKGEKMDAIVRDAVMLGVTAIHPLISSRTEVSRGAVEKSGRVERWQRIAIASAKQSGRAVVPEVCQAATFEQAIHDGTTAVMLIEPAASNECMTLRDLSRTLASAPPDALTLIVGPEGGWTAEEVQQARAGGAMLLQFGAQTLRADAVPIVALTALRVQLEDF